ncbi:MAG: hypothetical protein QME79_14770 [Bacillota bacterium]|nr:hypothetical protein [Bacillota bacterium]
MRFVVSGVSDRLRAKGIDLLLGSGVEELQAELARILPVESWGYGFATDELEVVVDDAADPSEVQSVLSAWGAEVKQA